MDNNKDSLLTIRSVNDINDYDEIDDEVQRMVIDEGDESIDPVNTTISEEQRYRVQSLLQRDPAIQQELLAQQNLKQLLEQRDNQQPVTNRGNKLPKFNNNRNREKRNSPRNLNKSPLKNNTELKMSTPNIGNQPIIPIAPPLPQVPLQEYGNNNEGLINNRPKNNNNNNNNNNMNRNYQERELPSTRDTYASADRVPYFDGTIESFDMFEQAVIDMEINLNNRDHRPFIRSLRHKFIGPVIT